jgi:hypothetical protein
MPLSLSSQLCNHAVDDGRSTLTAVSGVSDSGSGPPQHRPTRKTTDGSESVYESHAVASHGHGEAKQHPRRRGAAASTWRPGDGEGAGAVVPPPRRREAAGSKARWQALARVRARQAGALPADGPGRPVPPAVAGRLLAAVGLRFRAPRRRP